MGPGLYNSMFLYLTGVTLADEYTNSIPTDSADRAIQGNLQQMQVVPFDFDWDQF